MRDIERRKLEKFEREQTFMTDNAADFPVASPGGRAAQKHGDIIDELRSLAARQISGANSAVENTGIKQEGLDDLLGMIRNLNRAANAFEDEVPGVDLQFRIPRNRSQQNLLATARAFHTDATAHRAKFVEYGLPDDFLTELMAKIVEVDTAGSEADSGGDQRSAATGGLLDAARRGIANSRKLDAIVRVKYQHNPQKLAAWTVASHLHKTPKKSEAPPQG